MGQLTIAEKRDLQDRTDLATALTVDLETLAVEGDERVVGWSQEAKYALLYRMRTSIDPSFTLADQAHHLGRSVSQIKRWAASDEYGTMASNLTVPTRDEIVDAAHDFMQDTLLPLSLRRLFDTLSDENTKSTALLQSIKLVLERTLPAGAPDRGHEERRDVMEFLKERGQVVNNTLIIQQAPPELAERLGAIVPGDFDEITDLPSEPT